MTRLPATALDDYAQRIMAHLEFHTRYVAPPGSYQFVLPDGRFLSVNDAVVGRRRVLYFLGYDLLKPNLARRVTAVLTRPRRLSVEGPWFLGNTDRERAKAMRLIRHAVEMAYGGRDTDRVPSAILVDPMQAPVELRELPGEHRAVGLPGEEE
jgi:hypothetical protein